ncbi:LUD domain-containing protein [Actinospica durhamensis]|uniref:LUD domain-containing protein n=1 Tax=Actinospica durhamensis TaxID=1508375 RepID=A0A941EFL6_9ACTN|nr:LUD domain-containing protein [Actinospica durhamensis]MBR7831755.1 LUD domain-containing protein [Actinospica durhamensis]
MSSREQILARIRAATETAPEPASVERDYAETHTPAGRAVDLLAEHLTDYRAHVHRCGSDAQLAPLIADLLTGTRLVAPPGLTAHWIPAGLDVLCDDPPLTPATLDSADAVLTTCAVAIAETGTLVLDGGAGQGRRVLTLIPDHHICVVRTAGDVVLSLPQALGRLDPARPLTWISGPSATSDIELDRVEGVHGPRRLDVVLLG